MTDQPTARERIENLWDRAFPVAPYLDAFAAEVRAAALREGAADLAEDVANALFAAAETEQGNGAMAVAALLRDHATEDGAR